MSTPFFLVTSMPTIHSGIVSGPMSMANAITTFFFIQTRISFFRTPLPIILEPVVALLILEYLNGFNFDKNMHSLTKLSSNHNPVTLKLRIRLPPEPLKIASRINWTQFHQLTNNLPLLPQRSTALMTLTSLWKHYLRN